MSKKALIVVVSASVFIIWLWIGAQNSTELSSTQNLGERIVVFGKMTSYTNNDLSSSSVWRIETDTEEYLLRFATRLRGYVLHSGLSSQMEDYYNRYVTVDGVVVEHEGKSGEKYLALDVVSIKVG